MHDHDLHDDPANSPSARAGLIPPWWDKPRGGAALDRAAWFEEQEREAAHALRVPPRARRRREREKRRSSRLDGRWHRRSKQRKEREARFDREHEAREVALDERAWRAWLASPDFTDE